MFYSVAMLFAIQCDEFNFGGNVFFFRFECGLRVLTKSQSRDDAIKDDTYILLKNNIYWKVKSFELFFIGSRASIHKKKTAKGR